MGSGGLWLDYSPIPRSPFPVLHQIYKCILDNKFNIFHSTGLTDSHPPVTCGPFIASSQSIGQFAKGILFIFVRLSAFVQKIIILYHETKLLHEIRLYKRFEYVWSKDFIWSSYLNILRYLGLLSKAQFYIQTSDGGDVSWIVSRHEWNGNADMCELRETLEMWGHAPASRDIRLVAIFWERLVHNPAIKPADVCLQPAFWQLVGFNNTSSMVLSGHST